MNHLHSSQAKPAAHHSTLVVEPLLKIPKPALPEFVTSLCQKWSKLCLIYLLDVWVLAFPKHLPEVLKRQLPAQPNIPSIWTSPREKKGSCISSPHHDSLCIKRRPAQKQGTCRIAIAFSSSSADCAGLQSTLTTSAAPCNSKFRELQPPLVRVSAVSWLLILRTCSKQHTFDTCRQLNQHTKGRKSQHHSDTRACCFNLHTSMSGRGSSQDIVYRNVGGNIGGASTLFSASTVAS